MSFARLQSRQGAQPRAVLVAVIFYRGCLRRGLGLKFKWWLVTAGGGVWNLRWEKGGWSAAPGPLLALWGPKRTRHGARTASLVPWFKAGASVMLSCPMSQLSMS